ncbi:unnamed protein product [Somion occarium]|uniref:Cytochrome P450 n=1 Tax=Somion occarium TaxID=3059160 RepID=A0ABP1DK02_9APHY
MSPLYYAIVIVALCVIIYRSRDRGRYPPSPPKHWLLGNLLDMPRTVDWDKLLAWRNKYGGMTYLSAFGRSVLVLNTAEVIKDLLDKRAKNYSHRPHTVMAGELFGLDKTLVFYDYNDRYRVIRRLTQQVLSPEASRKYQDLQLDVIKLLLDRLRVDPDDFREQCRLAASRMILTITYGLDIKTADSEYIVAAQHTMDTMTEAAMPGAYVVDLIPILKHLPRWFPFTTFHQIGDYGRKLITDLITRPYEHVERCLAAGNAPQSFVSDLLSEPETLEKHGKHSEDLIEDIKWTAGALFAAGVETSFTTMLIFFLLMALHPDVQAKARQEIDSVTGGNRVASLEDRPNLPYLQALLREVARWHVVVPTSLPRRTGEDDIYNGFNIPANTIIVPNIWALSQDVDDPKCFNPDRFLDSGNAQNPYEYIYGFGRRICPGRHVADNFLFLFAANTLSFFNVSSPDRPIKGLKMPSDLAFTPTLVSCPEPFACKIEPRSAAHAETIASIVME